MKTPFYQVFWILFISLMFLSGCRNPLSDESTVNSNFLPGLSDQNLISNPVNPKLVLMTQPSVTMAGTNISAMQLQLQDENGVLLALTGVPVTVSFNANPASGLMYGTQTKTSINGVVQFDDLKIDKAATGYKFIFSSTGYLSTVTSSFTVVSAAPSAANSTLSASALGALADNTTLITLTATLKDAYNNPVMGSSVLLSSTGTGNTITQPVGTTNILGQTTGTIKSTNVGAKVISISSPAGLSSVSTTVNFTNQVLAITTQPATSTAGSSLGNIRVELQDENGLVIPNSGVTITAAFSNNPGSAGTLGGTLTQNTVNGVAQFTDLNVTKAANGYTLVFTSTSYASATSSSFDITAGTPVAANSTLATSAATVLADNTTTATLTATLRDANNNPVSGATVQFAATGTGNTIVQPAAVTNASGQTTGTIKSTDVGAKVVSISTPAGFSAVTTTVTFKTQNIVITTQPANSAAGTALGNVRVELRDEGGTLIPTSGVPITTSFNTNPGSAGTLSGTLTQNTVNGVAQFTDLNVNKAATGYKLNFTSATYNSAVSSSFDISAGVPSATTSTLTANVGTTTADSIAAITLTATLRDAYSNLVSGATVNIASTGTGNIISQPASVTNASGQTTATIKSSVAEAKTISISSPTGLTSVTAAVTFTALTPFANVWSLDSTRASNYTLSASGIAFTSSNLAHKVLTLDQDNDSSYGFGAALTLTDTAWNASAMELNATGKTNGTGSFTSRIFSSPVNTNWTQLNWTSKFPACKALPNNKGIETAYTQYNVDMTGNVLLLHMDESAWSTAAGQVIDSSGSNIHGTTVASATTTASNGGKFDRAAALTTNGKYLSFPHAASLDNTTAVTVETWIYPTTSDSNARGIISNRDSATNTAYSMFVYTSGHVFIDIGGSNGTNRYDTGYVPTSNTWTHIAFVFDGSLSSNRLKFYVNGALNYQTNPTPTSIPSVSGALTYVGALVGNTTTTFPGYIDEVAIYRRALTSTEISNRYNRGTQRIKFQVRACDQADCSDQSFTGPAGSTTDYYTESSNTGITAKTSVALSGMTNKKYFQYKAVLSTSISSVTPQLAAVEVKPDLYDSGYPTVVNNSGSTYKNLSGFSASYAGAGEVRYQISNGTSWYYWNGTSWVTASGFGQTNTAAEINTNISTFAQQLGAYGTFSFKAFFNSGTNATNAASLSTVSVSGGN